ncbi:MAG: ribose-phosphate diphosphokinase [Patescibacteria group bacterium]|jgi:ribose-phosphate pyrophosphokinase
MQGEILAKEERMTEKSFGVHCILHQENSAEGICMFCDQCFCSQCLTKIGKKFICRDCGKTLYRSVTPHQLAIFSGRSNELLAQRVCNKLGVELGKMRFTDFEGSEMRPQFLENLRGRRVFIIQPTVASEDELGAKVREELLIMIRAAKQASAQEVCVVIPDFAYQRQERKTQPRIAISARLMIDLFETAGADRFVFVDLHAGAIQGFTNKPVDHLWATPLLLKEAFADLIDSNRTVFLTDAGYAKVVGAYARKFGVGFAVAHKEGRDTTDDRVDQITIIGNVSGKVVLIIDDIVKSAGTMIKMGQACLKNGAIKVVGGGIHGELTEGAAERIQLSCLDFLAVTDTVHIPERKLHEKIRVVSVDKLIADAIKAIYEYGSVSALFD